MPVNPKHFPEEVQYFPGKNGPYRALDPKVHKDEALRREAAKAARLQKAGQDVVDSIGPLVDSLPAVRNAAAAFIKVFGAPTYTKEAAEGIRRAKHGRQ